MIPQVSVGRLRRRVAHLGLNVRLLRKLVVLAVLVPFSSCYLLVINSLLRVWCETNTLALITELGRASLRDLSLEYPFLLRLHLVPISIILTCDKIVGSQM